MLLRATHPKNMKYLFIYGLGITTRQQTFKNIPTLRLLQSNVVLVSKRYILTRFLGEFNAFSNGTYSFCVTIYQVIMPNPINNCGNIIIF